MAQDKFDVGGMTCAACQAHVDRAVSKLDGVESVAVNLLAGSMLVDYDPAQVSPDDICTAVDRAGYSASPVDVGTGAAGSNGSAQARSGAAHMESPTKKLEAAALEAKLKAETVDVTVPGKAVTIGHKHPMYLALDEIKDIFVGMGFTILDGPEIELAYYNFDRLNAEEGHPSRDWSDTFYFDEDSRVMLRSQTSPMQVHAMETMKLPIRIVAPGRVYRKDEVDATHSPMFHQIEGMVIDKGVTMADLKGTLNAVMEQLFGKGTVTRFRPHHFPFTEPSCEMDVQCHKCGGKGCPTCKGEGWIEVLGAGMVHPKVLRNCGIDPDEYSGFAFGMGLERFAMGHFKISDLRLIFENDVRFLEQF